VPRKFKIDLPGQTIKSVIHETENQIILIRSIKKENGPPSRNTLIKAEVKPNSKVKNYFYRGFNIDDMLVIKKNWSKIIAGLVK